MKSTVAPAPHLRRAGWLITVAALVAIGFATLMPQPGPALGSHLCLLCGPFGGVNSALNVILFVPLGLGLALSGLPAKRAIAAVFALSVLIETAQLLVIPGRYATVGDVITNTIGGALGFALGRYAFTLFRPAPRIALALSVAWSAIWLSVETMSAFSFSPQIPRSDYYGQLARDLGNFEQFRGSVLRASIGEIAVSDEGFQDSNGVRQMLLTGGIVRTTVVPSNATRDIAPIVRIADVREREIMLLAQDGRDLVFGVRTGAGVLRLRPPAFAVAEVFPAVSSSIDKAAADEITASASYSARQVSLSTQTRRARRESRIPITTSLGWTLVLPFQWYIEGTATEIFLSAAWIACLVLPLGFWGTGATRISPRANVTRNRVVPVTIALSVLYAGLVAAPEMFGIPGASPGEWLAALIGLLLGVALATGVFRRMYSTASEPGGAVSVRDAPPVIAVSEMVRPVAGKNHSTASIPGDALKFTVTDPPEGK
jgi:hypothetical protein